MTPPSHVLSIRTSSGDGHVTVLSLRGDVDLVTAPQLREVILDAAGAEDGAVVIDLREVAFMDSPGLGTLIHCNRVLAESETTMILKAPQGPVRELFELVGLRTHFNIVD